MGKDPVTDSTKALALHYGKDCFVVFQLGVISYTGY